MNDRSMDERNMDDRKGRPSHGHPSCGRPLGGLIFLIICVFLSACSSGSSATNTTTPVTSSGGSLNTTSATAVPTLPTGARACPVAVSQTSYWNPIIGTQSGVSAVSRVTCAALTGGSTLQALVLVTYEGTGSVIDAYVYDTITSPSPTQLFKVQGLYEGDVHISAYNTLLTAEVDQHSSVNKNAGNAAYMPDLFREFAWSAGAGTFVPVSFPGLYPDLTRYQAEADQQQVNQGQNPWKLDAASVARTLAVTFLKWSNTATTTVVSGGGTHDTSAVVNVRSTDVVASTITVSLSRLEGNIHGGIWEATDVKTDGLSITSPQTRDRLNSPVTVTGTGSAFEGVVGTVSVLDHLYNDIGHATVQGATGNGTTMFTVAVNYMSTFKTGAQEGVLMLYSRSTANGSIAGVVMIKELL